MMKTTQFLTNVKFWQGIFVSFLLLVSLNLNSQNVGDDLLANSNGQVDTSSGWGGSGAGCFSWNPNGANGANYDGVTQCGWTSGAGLNYAPGNGSHGPTHSGDRMFKSYKTNGSNGEFIAQELGEIALGTYSYSFFHRWTGGAVDYTEGAPKFTIKKANADGGYDNVLVVDLAVGETGASGAWTETAGSWENTEGGIYKIQVYKNGVANPGLAQNLHLDSFSFTYDAEPAPTGDCIVDAYLVSGGAYPSEVSWSVLSGDVVVASGDGYDLSVTSFGLSYGDAITINLVDSYGDGWNGAALNVGGVEYTFDTGTDASFVSEDICTADCSISAALLSGGAYPSEVSWSISSGGVEVASGDGYDTSVTTFGLSEGDMYTITLLDSYGDGWNGAVLSVDGVEYTFDTGTDASFEGTCADTPKLALQGIMDGDLGGSDGKALHLVATASISDLSAYGIGVDNNGGGSDGQEYTFDAISVEAGAHILLARNPDVMTAYLAASEVAFDHVIQASNSISQNGDDAISLYHNGVLVEVYGDPDVDGTGEAWEYTDSWAYKVDGAWTNGELGCMGGDSSCTSSCPYPFIADACPIIADCVVDAFLVDGGAYPSEVSWSISSGDDVVASGDGYDTSVTSFGLSYGESYTISLVDSYGDGWNGAVLSVDGAEYTFDDGTDASFEGSCASPMHDVTFNVDARNIIVHDKGMYMGGGIFGGADAVAMSDEDGDGIWSVTLSIEEGTTGNWAFFNSPGDGGDWGTKENLEGQPCADAANYNDRVVPAFDADNLEFNFCFAVCNDTNSFCAETVERANVTFTVGTADIEVGANGMFVGGGAFGGSNGHAMADNGDDTHSVTISVPVGLTGHYAFFNSPGTHYDWGTKEQLGGLECGDSSNYDDRPLAEVTGDTSISFCFGTCETECAAPNNGIAEFPACFDFEGETALDGWLIVPLEGTAGNPTWAQIEAPAVDGSADPNSILAHQWGDPDVELINFAISPMFNTSGMSDAQLSFDEIVVDGSYGTAHRVWVSTDEVLSFTSENLSIIYDNIYEPDNEYNNVVLDLPEADFVTVIFQYEGTWGSLWGIDNVCVEETPAEPNFVTADPNNAWGGYMEVFEVNADGSAGGFVFGQPWGVEDLQTVLQPDVPNMILYPNFNAYNADDPFWSNGEMGNKIMRATTQVESWDMYNGADLTFTGSVAEHTLEGYETVYFIKCLDPDAGWTDMLEDAYVLPLPDSGEFSVSVSGDLLPAGKLVQFGFSVIGLNANPAFDYGKVVIGDIGLSIGENDSLDMVIYPNPVDGDYVTIQTPLNGDKLVEVFDVNGRKVMERLLTTDTLNVSSISAGMYIVKVTVEDQSNVSKLIIE